MPNKHRLITVALVVVTFISTINLLPIVVAAQQPVALSSILNHVKVGWLKLASVEAARVVADPEVKDQELLAICGLILAASGQEDLARTTYLRIVAEPGVDSLERSAYYALIGRTYLDQHDYEQAKEYYLKSLAENEEEILSLVDLGIIEMRQEHLEAAAKYLTKAKAVDKLGYPELYQALGDLSTKQGNQEEALAQYQKALNLDPSSIMLYLKIQRIYQDQGDREKETLLLEQAKSLGIQLP